MRAKLFTAFEKMNKTVYILILFLIFFFAFALRVGITWKFVGLSSPPDINAQPDQERYEILTYNLMRGKGYVLPEEQPEPTGRVPPGMPLTLLPVYAIFGRSFVAARIWLGMLSALTCIITAFIARPYLGRATAVLAGIMLALYPNHFYYAMHLVTEVPYALFTALALMFAVASLHQAGVHKDLLAGFFWGASALTRPQTVLILPLGFLAALLSRNMRGTHVRRWAIQAAVLVLMVTPWVVRNAVVIGKAALSTHFGNTLWDGHNELLFNDPKYHHLLGTPLATTAPSSTDELLQQYPLHGSEVERDDQAKRYALESIRNNLDQMPLLTFAKLKHFVSPFHVTENAAVKWAFAGGWIVAALLMCGGIWKLWNTNRTFTVLMLLPFIVTLTTCLIFFSTPRYRDAVAPAYMVLAAAGMHHVLYWLAKPPKNTSD